MPLSLLLSVFQLLVLKICFLFFVRLLTLLVNCLSILLQLFDVMSLWIYFVIVCPKGSTFRFSFQLDFEVRKDHLMAILVKSLS